MQIKFGRQQLKNPTPRSIAWKIALTSAIGGYLITFVQTSDWMGDVLQHVLTTIIGGIVGLANTIGPFFGVETTAKKVDIEDVGTLEDKK